MKTAYLDCSAGISGDMCLGALVDAGARLPEIKRALGKIPLSGYNISSRRVTRAGFSATRVNVTVKQAVSSESTATAHHVPASQHSGIRRWKDIKKLINNSTLDESIKQKGLHIFKSLFEAEGHVHGEPFDTVHLHELGAVDSIVDIFGTLIALDLLGIEKVFASPVNLGQGTVRTSHGSLPVPAPATIELLKGSPVYSSGIPFELTTPTGASILKAIVTAYGPLPKMNVEKIGYGAGARDIADMPNALRIMIGAEHSSGDKTPPDETVVILETNIDDMNPQYYENILGRLFAAGALDVFLENIIMKKSRPAVKLTAIIRENDADKMAELIFRETTTIGLRLYRAERKVLKREEKKVKTRHGAVRFKISRLRGKVVTVTPEYEDLKAISETTGIPIKIIASELSGSFRLS